MRRCVSMGALLLWIPLAALAQQVTVDVHQTPLGEVLEEIERQTGVGIRHSFDDQGGEP